MTNAIKKTGATLFFSFVAVGNAPLPKMQQCKLMFVTSETRLFDLPCFTVGLVPLLNVNFWKRFLPRRVLFLCWQNLCPTPL